MSVTDITELLRQRRAAEQAPPPEVYSVLLLKDMSLGELAMRLRSVGLGLSNRHGFIVLHTINPPPQAG